MTSESEPVLNLDSVCNYYRKRIKRSLTFISGVETQPTEFVRNDLLSQNQRLKVFPQVFDSNPGFSERHLH